MYFKMLDLEIPFKINSFHQITLSSIVNSALKKESVVMMNGPMISSTIPILPCEDRFLVFVKTWKKIFYFAKLINL